MESLCSNEPVQGVSMHPHQRLGLPQHIVTFTAHEKLLRGDRYK